MLASIPLWLSLACTAAGLPPQSPPAESQRAEQYRADLALLTGEAADGRATGTVGARVAIEHLEERFRALGLRPGWAPRAGAKGPSTSYRQEFFAPDRSPRSFSQDDTWLRWNGEAIAQVGVAAAPFRGSTSGRVDAPVVFAGYGVRWRGVHDDYAGLDVRDKVVLVLRGLPKLTASVRSRLSRGLLRRAASFDGKLALAKERGAVGFLLCDPRFGDDVAAEHCAVLDAPRTLCDGKLPALWIAMATARRLFDTSGTSGTERPTKTGGQTKTGTFDRLVEQAGAALVREAARLDSEAVLGANVSLQVQMGPASGDLPATNLIGRIDGRGSSGECVVIGAHYDHIGRGLFASLGGPAAVGKLHPGADDNASGVAGLLELARILRAADRPRRTVYIVAFGAEEQGRIGSRRFLEALRERGERPIVMLNLNMIGRGASGLRIEGAGSAKQLRTLVGKIAERSALRVTVRQTASGRSDHQTFLLGGVPALLFHTGLHKQYHRPTDVAALVQVGEAVRIAALAAEVAQALANREESLDFNAVVRRRR